MSFQAGMPNLPRAAPREPGVPVQCSWCGSKGKYDQLLNGRDLRRHAKASRFDFCEAYCEIHRWNIPRELLCFLWEKQGERVESK